MEKHPTDRAGEIFEDELTENQSEADGPRRDEVAHHLHGDPDVDSQEDDRAMEENRFGVNEPKKP